MCVVQIPNGQWSVHMMFYLVIFSPFNFNDQGSLFIFYHYPGPYCVLLVKPFFMIKKKLRSQNKVEKLRVSGWKNGIIAGTFDI